jgi:hypothetical protein
MSHVKLIVMAVTNPLVPVAVNIVVRLDVTARVAEYMASYVHV